MEAGDVYDASFSSLFLRCEDDDDFFPCCEKLERLFKGLFINFPGMVLE